MLVCLSISHDTYCCHSAMFTHIQLMNIHTTFSKLIYSQRSYTNNDLLHKDSSTDTCVKFKYQQQLWPTGDAWSWDTFVLHVCCQHEHTYTLTQKFTHTQMQSRSQWHTHTTGLCFPHAADKPQLFSLPPSLFANCLFSFVALPWALFDVNCWL